MKKIITLVASVIASSASAQTAYSPMSWGLNKGVTPYAFGTNINGAWTNLGTVSSAGVWNLTIPALPGLSSDVIPAVGMPGLNMANCTSAANCGWFLYSSPTAYPAANTPTLRVQQSQPSTGGPTGGFVNKALWILGSSGANNPEYYWPLTSVLYNSTLASTGAENVAVNGTANKILGTNAPGSIITKTWGGNFVCDDQTGVINPPPGAQCIGTEVDLYVQAGMSTDANKQRTIMHLAGGPKTTDTNAHIGRGLLISPIGQGVIDNAIELLEAQGAGYGETFVVKGDGSTKISSNLGNWSSFDVGKQLVVGPQTAASNNPSIGILDTNSSNPWAIANSVGDLKFYAMPALNDSTSVPVTALTLARPNGAASFNSSVAILTNNLLTFADATGAISGTNGTAILNNSGTTYIDSYSGPFTFRGNAFAVLATLSSTGATFNVLPKIKGSSTGVTAIGTANSSATDYTATLPANTGTIAELNLAQTFSANQTFGATNLRVQGSSTGVTAIGTANSSATDYTATLPDNTGTIAETNLAQTFSATQTFSAPIAAGGSAPTGSGTCAISAQTGGQMAGKFQAGNACVIGSTVTLTFATTMPTGYVCDAQDQTTPTTIFDQTANTSTTVTFTTRGGATGAADAVVFKCVGF